MANMGHVPSALKLSKGNFISEWSSKMSKKQDDKWDKSVGLKEGSTMDKRLDALLKGNKKKR